MTTYVDVDRDTREDLTLFASTDGFSWFKVYKLQEGFNGFGYGNVSTSMMMFMQLLKTIWETV